MNIHSKSKYDEKCHNYTLHTNPRHRDEDTQNTDTHTTLKRQLQLSKHPSLPQRDDCNTFSFYFHYNSKGVYQWKPCQFLFPMFVLK